MSIKTREPSEAFKRQVSPNIPMIKKKQRSWRSDSDEKADLVDHNSQHGNASPQISKQLIPTSTPIESGSEGLIPSLPTTISNARKDPISETDQKKVKNKASSAESSTANLGSGKPSFGTILIEKELILKLAQVGLAGREIQILMFMLYKANGDSDNAVSVTYADISAITGIIPQHLPPVLGKLIEKNLLIKKADQSNRRNSYRINRKFFISENSAHLQS